MAPADISNNWLSFSLSPMEMLATSQSATQLLPPSVNVASSQHYYIDPFYPHDWVNNEYVVEQPLENPTPPKLEDFLGGDNSVASYNSQTESATQDTSSQLTHLYDPNPTHNYFAHHPNPNPNPNPLAFSANSGSEVDDSQLGCGGGSEFVAQSIESTQLLSTFNGSGSGSGFGSGESLSLAVVTQNNNEKAIIATDNNNNNNVKKIADTFGQRTSIYRGVTRHRWTGRYEAHLWDNSCRREGQARKGRQVYLGGYDKEDKAARAYDLAALKYWGPTATTNFPISNYTKELEEMKHSTKQEFIASLRRKSSGFSRGASIYRGVTRHHQQGRWQARIGRVAGNKDLYLGTFATEEEAAEAYDIAAIKFRGVNAVTNFEMNRYDVEAILNSNLPIGGAAKRLKLGTQSSTNQKPALNGPHVQSSNVSGGAVVGSTINFGAIQGVPPIACATPFDAATAMFHQNLLHHFGSTAMAQGVPSELPYGTGTVPAEFYIWPHQSY